MTTTTLENTDAVPERRLLLGVCAGFAAAIVGALAWAALTVTTNYQIGWMAVGVGLLVGFALRLANGGKGIAILGAFLALFGCVLGNFLSLVAFEAREQHMNVLTVLAKVDYENVASALWDDFLSTSILFYAIAVYEGYKFSVAPAKR